MSSGQSRQSTPAGRLSVVIEQLVRRLRTEAAEGGISPSVAAALGRLHRQGPLRVTELARLEGVSQPAMTQLAARMEVDGLVERTAPGDDRRGVLVSLTAHGRQVLERRRSLRTASLEAMLARLGEEERTALLAALPALERLAGDASEHASG